MLENVEEFKTWGPLDESGYPIKEKSGETFHQFVAALRKHGYEVDWRELRACDYGAPTSRKRFFLIARCDGNPIVWPEPSHGDPDSHEVRCGKLQPWRTAAEIIDWTIPCKSIFERDRPLADNTLRRIARGIQKFVIDNPKPFLVRIGQQGFGGDRLQYPLDVPLTTVVTKQEHCLIAPTIARQFGTATGHPIDKPLGTIMPAGAGGKSQLISANLIQYHTEQSEKVRGQEMEEPIMTLDASNRYGLVASTMVTVGYGEREGQQPRALDIDKPLGTIVSTCKHAPVAAYLAKHFGGNTQGLVLR
jgi:DNA (cytosine-5)-methyltransferase 1